MLCFIIISWQNHINISEEKDFTSSSDGFVFIRGGWLRIRNRDDGRVGRGDRGKWMLWMRVRYGRMGCKVRVIIIHLVLFLRPAWWCCPPISAIPHSFILSAPFIPICGCNIFFFTIFEVIKNIITTVK